MYYLACLFDCLLLRNICIYIFDRRAVSHSHPSARTHKSPTYRKFAGIRLPYEPQNPPGLDRPRDIWKKKVAWSPTNKSGLESLVARTKILLVGNTDLFLAHFVLYRHSCRRSAARHVVTPVRTIMDAKVEAMPHFKTIRDPCFEIAAVRASRDATKTDRQM